MKLDIGSVAFNLNIINGGGTPSWGTSLGQNVNYNYSVPGVEELLTSMLYCKVKEDFVFCPLGKGGNQQESYNYELASLYEKVYVNGKLIPSARFVLLIVKKIIGDYHVGRRTLKYSPKMTYQDKLINEECYNKMAETLGIGPNGSWLVYSIHTKNQDELHFDVLIADPNKSLEFSNSDERKNFILELLAKNGIVDYEKQNDEEINNEDITNDDELSKYKKYYINNLNRFKGDINLYDGIRLREEFNKEYPLDRINTLSLEEYALGTSDSANSLSYKLEFGKYKGVGLSIGGGSAAKHGIYKGKDNKYHGRKQSIIENPENFWIEFRTQLYDFLKEIGETKKYPNVNEKYPLIKNIPIVLTKLCYLYYPNLFINIGTKGKLVDIIDRFEIDDNSTISSEMSYNISKYLTSKIPELLNDDPSWIGHTLWHYMEEGPQETIGTHVDDINRVSNAYNKIYYGVPGSGKSYTVDAKFNEDEFKIFRTTFHPEYTNSDFVGQIIPVVKDNKVEYNFHPGSFTLALKYALDNKEKRVCLIIEEINRGNSSAIFGDIFQLLDRDENGKSKYSIFNGPIIDYLAESGINLEQIYIPSNLWIIATMNTSDQNIFTLDTAFKRRWKMEYIKNIFADNDRSKELRNKIIPLGEKYPNVTWEKFVTKINKHIISDTSGINAEDKQLGMYFVSIEEIDDPKEFAEKILSYLWEDVAKLNTSYWFGSITSYDELIDSFNKNSLDVFNSLFDEEIKVTDEYTINTIGE